MQKLCGGSVRHILLGERDNLYIRRDKASLSQSGAQPRKFLDNHASIEHVRKDPLQCWLYVSKNKSGIGV